MKNTREVVPNRLLSSSGLPNDMRIDESKIFQFRFPFMNGLELGFPVAAPNQHEAAQALKHWFEEAQKELAIMFPQVAPTGQNAPLEATQFNQLQMGLLEELSSKLGRKPSDILADFIREKTGLEMTLENFKLIVPILEGNKPPEHGKKKA